MKTKQIFDEADRNYLIELLIKDKWKEADTVARSLGFKEGVNAELFEKIIAKDGLSMSVIHAISVYYGKDLEVQ